MPSKFGFLAEEDRDKPLKDSYDIRIHFLYSGTNIDDFLFENYKDALSILEEDTSSIIKSMEKDGMRDYEDYLEAIDVIDKGNGKEYTIADIHLQILEQNGLDPFSIERFANNLIDSLNKSKNIDFLWIFRDDRQIENYKIIYEQIYKLEMRLRELISQIFFDRYYPPEIDNFIKDLKLDNQNTYNKLGRNKDGKIIKISNLREKNENIFFYLLFSEYSELTDIKDLNNKELQSALETASDFKERQENIFSRGITNEDHKLFLESIKDELKIIETVRNAIMHCRNINEDTLQNYHQSRENLIKKIKDFENEDDIFGLEEGKEYE